ncbi:MAG: hypothetical protein ACP5XB_05610 [Isosphaeraceae bacterium]
MNWTGIVGIPVLVASLGLAAAYAAESASEDDSAVRPAITLLSSASEPGVTAPRNGLDAGSLAQATDPEPAQNVRPSPAVPGPPEAGAVKGTASESEPAPVAEPLPSQAPSRSTRTQQKSQAPRTTSPAPRQRGSSSGGRARGTTKAAPGRSGATRPQEIQFDNQGMITLHTDELDVRQLLELLSRQSGLNILVSPTVSGNITANFEKISPDQLLQSVLKLAHLVDKVEGNVHFIYSEDDLKDQSETKMKEKIVTKVYRLNYIRADEMMVMITPFLSQDVGRKRFATTANYLFGVSEASTLSSGGLSAAGGGMGGMGGGMMAGGAAPGGAGTIQRGTQPPTGGSSLSGQDVLVIQDYESNLKIIDQIVEKIDVPPVQVLIEAVIIQVTLNKDKQLGVNFALVDNLGQQLGTIGSGYVINSNVGFSPTSVLAAPTALSTLGKIAGAATSGAAAAADPNGFASDTNGIKYGFISNNVTGFVRAIETLGSTKILASPRILVLNKQRAEIQLGSRLGFKSITTQNYIGTTQGVQFLNTGTLLRLRPFVSDDGLVRMEIHPERSVGVVDATTGLPSATTAEITTNVMVPNGTTLVIGGLMEDEDDYLQQGLPGLSRLPVLGALFGLKDKTDNRRELVVLLTPHVWIDNHETRAPVGVSARTRNGTPTAATSAGRREPGSPAATATGAAVVAASATAPGLAASDGAAGSAPMATRTGWWKRERGWFRDRHSQTASAPGSLTAVAQPTTAGLADGNVTTAGAPAANLAGSQTTGKPSKPPEHAQSASPASLAQPESASRAASLPGNPPAQKNKPIGQPIEGQPHDLPGGPPPDQMNLIPEPMNEPLPPLPSARVKHPRKTEMDPVVAQYRPQSRRERARMVDQSVIPASASLIRPAEQATPRPQHVDTQAGRYLVASGESFESIARKFYGSPQYASLLWWANRSIVAWPEALKPGTTILVPPLKELAEARINASSSRSRPTPRPTAVHPEPPGPFPLVVPLPAEAQSPPSSSDPHVKPAGFTVPATHPRASTKDVKQPRSVPSQPADDSVRGGGYAVHVVQQGETLQSIARDRLHDARRDKEIAALNRDLLGKDGRLTPGLRLLLPGDAGPPRAR